MTVPEQARAAFSAGANCAQAVLLAFAGEDGDLRALAAPFGGGMGRLRLTCGAVTGAVMALGLKKRDLPKSELYALVQEFARRFEAENGSVICGELLRGAGVRTDTSPNAEARTPAYYKKRPCPELVFSAAKILEELLQESSPL